ncbi:MAG: hypothetical protein PHV00_05905 [Syntrophales bacterium]|jgi:hypothetical protein|nr:hypothetical protein [Syntrophales bacterium]
MFARMNPFNGQMELTGIDYVIQSRPPVYADVDYAVPMLWIDDSNDALWVLLRVSAGVGYWLLLGTVDPYSYGTEADETLVTEASETMILQ